MTVSRIPSTLSSSETSHAAESCGDSSMSLNSVNSMKGDEAQESDFEHVMESSSGAREVGAPKPQKSSQNASDENEEEVESSTDSLGDNSVALASTIVAANFILQESQKEQEGGDSSPEVQNGSASGPILEGELSQNIVLKNPKNSSVPLKAFQSFHRHDSSSREAKGLLEEQDPGAGVQEQELISAFEQNQVRKDDSSRFVTEENSGQVQKDSKNKIDPGELFQSRRSSRESPDLLTNQNDGDLGALTAAVVAPVQDPRFLGKSQFRGSAEEISALARGVFDNQKISAASGSGVKVANSVKSGESVASFLEAKSITAQVRDALKPMVTEGPNELSVQLDPPEWGKIHLKVSLDQNDVHLRVVAEHSFVKEALDRGIHQLRQGLSSEGLNLGNVHVGLGGDSQSKDEEASRDLPFDSENKKPLVVKSSRFGAGAFSPARSRLLVDRLV